ncbi:hypothetical protein GGS24DRAFT_507947 [Hypoxylon argillaceum]|nr:hypothetical protein GGS24DRAFT_507947 [Hypoxylon argillaceum]
MEQAVPDGWDSHQQTRAWTPSPISDNEHFEQYTFEPVSGSRSEHHTQPDQPQGQGGTITTSPKNKDSTTQPLQESRTLHETILGCWRAWILEIINCGLLLISLFAILATLYPHEGQPLPRWPLSITINALLSIYALFMKASMWLILASGIGQLQWSWFLSPQSLKDVVRYRGVADGPLGSLAWLYTHNVRQPLTALAAVIIIAAVAVDPFIHQLVQPVDCKHLNTEGPPPSIPRTNFLSYDGFPSDLLGYIASGYYTPQTLSDFICGTGNCTFNTEYSSLAYCSVCEDVSDTIQIEKHCMVSQDGKLEPGSCYQSNLSTDTPLSRWNLTTTLTAASSPLSLNFYYNIDPKNFTITTPKQNIFGVGKIPRRLDTFSAENTIDFISLGNDMGMILAETDISLTPYDPNTHGNRTGCDDAASNNTWWCRQYGVATCSLQPCVRSYVANVDDGRLKETLVGQSDANMTWGYGESSTTSGLISLQTFLGLLDTQCINDAERQNLTEAGYQIDRNTRWLPYNLTFNPHIDTPINATFPESLLAHKCLYALDSSFNSDIWTFMLDQFIIGIVQREYQDNSVQQASYSGPTQLLSMFDSFYVNETTINSAISRLADAMTLWIRTHGYASHSERAIGEEFRYAICVKVNWSLVALPAALTGLTLVFFLLTVISTHHQRLPVWKRSPLTFLFHGPEGIDWVNPDLVAMSSKLPTQTLMTERGMREFADKITIQVSKDEDESPYLRQVKPRSIRMRKPWGLWFSKPGKRDVGNDDLEYSRI